MSKTQLLHSLYSLPGFGETSLRKIAAGFPRAEDILNATREDFLRLGIGAKTTQIFFDRKSSLDTEYDWEILQRQNIRACSQDDPDYPKLLKEIPDAPPLLYVRGNVSVLNDRPCVAIVGTRKPTDTGRHITQMLARELAHAGVVVVSGLALGLDAEAHLGAIHAHGITVATLGNGLLDARIAPRTNFPIAKRILETNGALVSEFPPNTPASVGTFPMRNRVIAGLCLATVIVEAGEKSGTLITARLALEYNREVFAVPGSILSPLSQGANRLLKDGAHPVTATQDILDVLTLHTQTFPEQNPSSPEQKQANKNLSPEDIRILNALSAGPLDSNAVSRTLNLSPAIVNTRLTLLEIQGCIRDIGGGKYLPR